MKRILMMTALSGSILLGLLSGANGIDRARTGTQGTQPSGVNLFNPSTLPGQGGLGSSGASSDPFLPTGIYNPFPTLPGLNPNPSNPTIPNPQPNIYPNNDSSTNRIRVQDPMPTYIPPGQNPDQSQNRWRLGILSRDTESGVKIHEIVNGSAAQRAGLEVNDLIVNVNGYQVGLVNGTLYELSKEFERNADQNGMVTMLVQDRNTLSLMNLAVQLDSRYSVIRGSLTLQNSAQIPRDSVVTIELQEIVRQGAPPLTIARKEIANPRQSPLPFQLEYDPAQVSHQGDYVLTAYVISNGRQAFKTIQSYRVNNQGYGDDRPLAMRLEPIRPTYNGTTPQIDESARVATIVRWFNEYLGREPTDRELNAWLQTLDRGYSLKQVQLQLLGHEQFFNRCDRNKELYVRKVHELLVGRQPTTQEFDYWVGRYDALGGVRRDMASEFQDAVGIRL